MGGTPPPSSKKKLICVALFGVDKFGSTRVKLGKHRMIECGKLMHQVSDTLWVCPVNHQRHYPFSKRENKKNFGDFVEDF